MLFTKADSELDQGSMHSFCNCGLDHLHEVGGESGTVRKRTRIQEIYQICRKYSKILLVSL